MRKYEIMFIVDPNVPEEEVDQLNSQVSALVTDGGGQVETLEKMGRKKLAYEVDRRKEGYYVLFAVMADGRIIREIERRFRVVDAVLRYITVRVDEDQKKLEKVRAIRQRKSSRRTATGRPARVEQPAGS